MAFSATHAIMITLNLRGGGGRGEKEGNMTIRQRGVGRGVSVGDGGI